MSAIIRGMGQLQIDFESADSEVDILCICSGNAKRKCVFEAYAESEGPDQTKHAQSDQVLHCPFPELFDSSASTMSMASCLLFIMQNRYLIYYIRYLI